jgi:CheY-like chemotaxis protein
MKKKILLVDDEKEILDTLSNILTRRKFEVATASSAKDALELVKTIRPDVILLDVLLPDMDGTVLAMTLQNDTTTRDIPIVFLTGMLTKQEELPGKTREKYFAVAKPVGTDELVSIIDKALRS